MTKTLLTLCGLSLTATTLLAQPANDDCFGATNIQVIDDVASASGNADVLLLLRASDPVFPTFTNAGATADSDMLTNCTNNTGAPDMGIQNGVYYSFIGDGRIYTFSVMDPGGNNAIRDPQLGIYEGRCSDLMQVACDEDGGNATFSTAMVDTEYGQTYYLIVDSYAGTQQGTFDLMVSVADDPTNKFFFGYDVNGLSCFDAEPIDGLLPTSSGQTFTSRERTIDQLVSDIGFDGQTDEDLPFQAANFVANDVTGCFGERGRGFFNNPYYFKFRGTGATYTFRTIQCAASGNAPDLQMVIGQTAAGGYYQDDCVSAAMTEVAGCNDDEDFNGNVFDPAVTVATQRDRDYLILVDNYGGDSNANPNIPASARGNFCLQVTTDVASDVTEVADSEIALFPNPTGDWLNFSAGAGAAVTRIDVHDATGRRVASHVNPIGGIQMGDLPNGVYTLLIATADDQVRSSRILKQ